MYNLQICHRSVDYTSFKTFYDLRHGPARLGFSQAANATRLSMIIAITRPTQVHSNGRQALVAVAATATHT